MERVKVMLAIPSRDVWKSDFGVSLAIMACASISQMPNLDMIIYNQKGASLAMNRIDLCQKAIDAKCDYILFLDDDMRLPMETLLLLLSRQVDIIGANCARRELPPVPTAKGFNGDFVYSREHSTGIEKVKSVGTGVMLVHTAVFENIPKPWFCEDPVQRIGEDVWFCNQAREAGYSIYIDHDVSKGVLHIGEFEYSHQIMDGYSSKGSVQ